MICVGGESEGTYLLGPVVPTTIHTLLSAHTGIGQCLRYSSPCTFLPSIVGMLISSVLERGNEDGIIGGSPYGIGLLRGCTAGRIGLCAAAILLPSLCHEHRESKE